MEQLIPIFISLIALIISIISLWKNYLAPFRLRISYSEPVFSIYKITPNISGGKSTWWIPSIDIGLTFHNLGCNSGEILDIRILAKTGNKKINNFYAKWIVEFSDFDKYRHDRMRWINNSIMRNWYSLIVPAKQHRSMHLILEDSNRWDNKFECKLKLYLEIYSSQKNKWIKYNEYEHYITKEMFEEKSIHTLNDNKLLKTRK